MLERKNPLTAKIAIFCVAHNTYFEQFSGLYESLIDFHNIAIEKINKNQVEICDFGMIDTNEKAYQTALKIKAFNPDLIFCNMITYATSSVVAPIIRENIAPIVLLALQPQKALDYNKASTFLQLQNDNICSVPEFTGVAIRLGHPVSDVIIGTLEDDSNAEQEINEWCKIANVLHSLKGARIGLMGHVLESMYDMHVDPTAVSASFGVHVPLLEIDDLTSLRKNVSEQEIENKKSLILSEFDTPDPKSDPVTEKLTANDLYESAKTACALDHFIEKHNLDGLAYYYEGLEDSPVRQTASTLIVGNSILGAQGFAMCGEFDLKTCIAMFIMDKLDIGGSFAEMHPFDFNENFILVGHDGPHHLRIAEGKPVLRSLKKYHGKPGKGASVEFKIKEGPITMLGITTNANGKFKFVIGEGQSKKGPIPPTGNTNTRGFFNPSTKEFVKKWVMEGPTHHFALGVGHNASTIKKIADILGIEAVIVK